MINANYNNLVDSYLFYNIAQRIKAFSAANPDTCVFKLGIGDVTLPLPEAVTSATINAAKEMGDGKTFRGYDDSRGYDFLRLAVRGYYSGKGVNIEPDEIFISDGAKSDLGNILEIFGAGLNVVVPDPVYPVYVDTNVMAGNRVIFAAGNEDNGFLPLPRDISQDVCADLIYICSPNNPTGAAYDADGLKIWVDYANERGAVILYDAAYEIFARNSGRPTSIYQIEGAGACAIEFCSLSKTAGFTGTRCGYTIVPMELVKNGRRLNDLWLRRRTTKFNGVPYIIQRAAEAVFTDDGFKQIIANIEYYEENAGIIADGLSRLGVWFTGGDVSPYIWLRCPRHLGSWEFFDRLLNTANVVGTPGAGFGRAGENYFRLTAFGDRAVVSEAVERIEQNWGNL